MSLKCKHLCINLPSTFSTQKGGFIRKQMAFKYWKRFKSQFRHSLLEVCEHHTFTLTILLLNVKVIMTVSFTGLSDHQTVGTR